MSPDVFARLKICKNAFTAPDPVWGAHSAPQTLSWIWGPFCGLGWEGEGRKGEGKETEEKETEGKGREREEKNGGEGRAPETAYSR